MPVINRFTASNRIIGAINNGVDRRRGTISESGRNPFIGFFFQRETKNISFNIRVFNANGCVGSCDSVISTVSRSISLHFIEIAFLKTVLFYGFSRYSRKAQYVINGQYTGSEQVSIFVILTG